MTIEEDRQLEYAIAMGAFEGIRLRGQMFLLKTLKDNGITNLTYLEKSIVESPEIAIFMDSHPEEAQRVAQRLVDSAKLYREKI